MKLTQWEIRIIYHLIDCIGPDLERNEFDMMVLKKNCEYLNSISLNKHEYKDFLELKQKLTTELIGF